MSIKNSNNYIEDDLNKVSGGTGFFKKIGNKFKGWFSKKDKTDEEITAISECPLFPNDDEN